MERDMLFREVKLNYLPQVKFNDYETPVKKQKKRTRHNLNKGEILQIQKILKINLGFEDINRTGDLNDAKTIEVLNLFIPNNLWEKLNFGEIRKLLKDAAKAIVHVSGKAKDLDVTQLPVSIDETMKKGYEYQLKDFAFLVEDIVEKQILILETWMYALNRMLSITNMKSGEKAPSFTKIVADEVLKKTIGTLLKEVPLGGELYNSVVEYRNKYDAMLAAKDSISIYSFIFNLEDDCRNLKKKYTDNKSKYKAQLNSYFNDLRNDKKKQEDYFKRVFDFKNLLSTPDFDIYFIFIVESWINNSRNTEKYASYSDYKNGIVNITISHDWQKVDAYISAPFGEQIGKALTKFGIKPFDMGRLRVHRRFSLIAPNGFPRSQAYIDRNNVPKYIMSGGTINDAGMIKKIQQGGLPATLKISGDSLVSG